MAEGQLLSFITTEVIYMNGYGTAIQNEKSVIKIRTEEYINKGFLILDASLALVYKM